MSKYLAEIVSEIRGICQDEDNALGTDDSLIETQISRALRILSRKNAHVSVLDQIGDGSSTMYSVPSDWTPGFSQVLNVWFPFDKNDDDATEKVDAEQWDVFEYETGVWKFRLLDDVPGATQYSRWQYTAIHTITETASTLDNAADEDSVIWLAASFCFEIMAAKAVAVRNSGLSADAVDYQSRSAQYLALAKQFRGMSGLGEFIGETDKPKATAFVLQDLEPRARGWPWITHTGTAY